MIQMISPKNLPIVLIIGFFCFLLSCKDEGNPTPTDPGDTTRMDTIVVPPPLVETLLTSYYIAANGFEDYEKTIRVSNLSPVRVLVDEQGNSPDITFRGLEAADRDTLIKVPRMPQDQPPTFYSHTGGMYLPNVEKGHYVSESFEDGVRSTPFEYWAVVRNFRTLQQESIFAPGSLMPRLRLRELRYSEWGINGDEIDYPESGGIPAYLEKTVIRMKYDPPNSQLYYNMVGLGEAAEINDIRIERIGFGSNGHGQNHELYALGYIDGVLNDSDAMELFEELVDLDSLGFNRLPQTPVAIPTAEDGGVWDDLINFYDRDNERWYLSFDYNAENGLEEDKSRREFQWYWGDTRLNGDLTNFLNRQHAIPGATDSVLVRSDYALGNSFGNQAIFRAQGATCDEVGGNRTCYIRISASIKLYDTQGNSFGEVQTNWVVDNVD